MPRPCGSAFVLPSSASPSTGNPLTKQPTGVGNPIEKHTSDAVLNRNHPSPPRPLKCVYLCRQPHIETHLAPLTTLFLSIQDVPGSSQADPLGCLYLSIQIGNVFLYVVAEAESPNSLRVPWFQPFLHLCVGSYIRGPPCFFFLLVSIIRSNAQSVNQLLGITLQHTGLLPLH